MDNIIHYERIVRSRRSILISGETGTGKTTLAKDIHRFSDRADKPLSIKGCGASSPSLILSELFGHMKGSFTDAVEDNIGLFRAHAGGTVILDDIDALNEQQQTPLLTFLDTGVVHPIGAPSRGFPVDVRIIATTNLDLDTAIKSGSIRSDLFYRLSGLRVDVKPLRNRKSEFPEIIRILEDELCREFASDNLPMPKLGTDAIELLKLHNWPGNFRELKSVVSQAFLFATPNSPSVVTSKGLVKLLSLQGSSDILVALKERARNEPGLVQKILVAAGGNKALASEISGLSRETIYRKIEKIR